MGYVKNVVSMGGLWRPVIMGVLLFVGVAVRGQGMTGPVQMMPDFSFLRDDGTVLVGASLPQGKPVMIMFVDVECEHCQRTVRAMNDSAALFARVPVYMVSMAGQAALRRFALRYGPRLTAEWLHDPDARNMVRFRPVRYPAMFLFGGDKRLLDYEDNPESLFRIERRIAAF